MIYLRNLTTGSIFVNYKCIERFPTQKWKISKREKKKKKNEMKEKEKERKEHTRAQGPTRLLKELFFGVSRKRLTAAEWTAASKWDFFPEAFKPPFFAASNKAPPLRHSENASLSSPTNRFSSVPRFFFPFRLPCLCALFCLASLHLIHGRRTFTGHRRFTF